MQNGAVDFPGPLLLLGDCAGTDPCVHVTFFVRERALGTGLAGACAREPAMSMQATPQESSPLPGPSVTAVGGTPLFTWGPP